MEPKRWLNLDKIKDLSFVIFPNGVRFLFFQFKISFSLGVFFFLPTHTSLVLLLFIFYLEKLPKTSIVLSAA